MENTEIEHIIRSVRPAVLRLCGRFLSNTEETGTEAEDLTQETLMRLWQMRGRLHEYRNAESLAITIAKNVCIDHYRQRKPQDPTSTANDMADECSADSGIMEQDLREWYANALQRLPATQRRMLEMRAEGISLDEIAAICHTTRNSAKTLISTARHTLLNQIRKKR